ncbi:30S ribosomal protein S15 [Metamycoplasma hyosynoviae]|uniref:30S ribosomal protein S15 n=1 Tax=Metamycoplasma hyosynoviae TaxID=29559 RepID=UPI00235920EF|nr:30S ribosomal protein S15 [Metamycoplasma hyosynoviae]MDC8919539.1 30S ribosomal protein S15 [Metamycoplasma hyosynoviae]MDD1371966.1 30S ribosomal protein S15 [Metamycoplasma hyosynoviae]MDI3064052.1 30S ribosomal protein S15 [Metamycoplasma hyosynoviae]
MISKQQKLEITKKFGRNAKDTGYLPVQIAILTAEIEDLKIHFEKNKKDLHSMRGFLAKVNHRKDLLNHLKEKDYKLYEKTIKDLNIRK